MYGKILFLLNFCTILNSIFVQKSNLNHYYTKTKFENSTGLYFEPIGKIQFFKEESYLISYLDIYKILNMQSSLIEIYKNAIHFCKNIQENIYCIKEYSNKRFNSQKFKTANLIEKIHYLFNDTKIIIPKYLPNFLKDDFELEGEIINSFKDTKYNSYLSSHPLNNTMTNLKSTFNIISIYNFWIQNYPEYKNDKKSTAIEWLNYILGLLD